MSGLPLGTVDAAFDVDILLYTNTPNPKLIKKYSSHQEASKIFGIFYGNRARNPQNKRYIPYIMMQEAMKDIKMQIFQDRNLILQKINEPIQNNPDKTESLSDNNDNTNNQNNLNTNSLLRNSEAIREQWKLKGGKLYSTTVSGGISYLSYNNDGFSMKGNGFNLGLNRGFYKFKAPQYTTGRSTWSSFSLFESIEFSQMKSTIEMAEIPDITSEYQTLTLALQLGYVKGIGRYLTETKWKGLVFGIHYKPTMVATISDSESDPYFNYTSFSIDISSASFNSAMNKIAPKPGYKFSLFVLPPINDKPLFINASLGITLYN
ncbi:MAG: hypothetical protein C0599_14735 [Salinivirgaceae bacterium]|nr:MAG: hypothetical protein C0599_14735 [Salinivirgaceae bacterium]